MVQHQVNHIPVVDVENRLVGIVYEDSLRKESLLTIPVVIMAGGLGAGYVPLRKKSPNLC